MWLNTARLSARTDTEGNMLRLKEQDRSMWNQGMMARGLLHLGPSAAGDQLTAYHLQAGIAACHCAAVDYASTDWPQILSLYDRLVELDDSPVVALNRAVAVAEVHGTAAGLAAIESMPKRRSLESYYLLYSVLAEFALQREDFYAAAEHLRRAIQLAAVTSEQSFLTARLRRLEAQSQAVPVVSW